MPLHQPVTERRSGGDRRRLALQALAAAWRSGADQRSRGALRLLILLLESGANRTELIETLGVPFRAVPRLSSRSPSECEDWSWRVPGDDAYEVVISLRAGLSERAFFAPRAEPGAYVSFDEYWNRRSVISPVAVDIY